MKNKYDYIIVGAGVAAATINLACSEHINALHVWWKKLQG